MCQTETAKCLYSAWQSSLISRIPGVTVNVPQTYTFRTVIGLLADFWCAPSALECDR